MTGQAVAAIGSITTRIREINGVTTSMATAAEQQGAATQEIVRNVAGVAQASEATGAAAGQVLSAASELSHQSEHLGAEISRFPSTVRAA